MMDPLARTQIELGALRMVVKALVGRLAIANSNDAAGAAEFVDGFRGKLHEAVERINFNIDDETLMSVGEAKELTRRAIDEAVGGIEF